MNLSVKDVSRMATRRLLDFAAELTITRSSTWSNDGDEIRTGRGFELPAELVSRTESGIGMNIKHKDPFGRLLIAQAQAEDMALVSNVTLLDQFAINRLW
jgi:hypothetical protein